VSSAWSTTGDLEVVRLLLARSFDVVEWMWSCDPLNETLARAAVIREFMLDHEISPRDVEGGVQAYLAHRRRQRAELARLGLGLAKEVGHER